MLRQLPKGMKVRDLDPLGPHRSHNTDHAELGKLPTDGLERQTQEFSDLAACERAMEDQGFVWI